MDKRERERDDEGALWGVEDEDRGRQGCSLPHHVRRTCSARALAGRRGLICGERRGPRDGVSGPERRFCRLRRRRHKGVQSSRLGPHDVSHGDARPRSRADGDDTHRRLQGQPGPGDVQGEWGPRTDHGDQRGGIHQGSPGQPDHRERRGVHRRDGSARWARRGKTGRPHRGAQEHGKSPSSLPCADRAPS